MSESGFYLFFTEGFETGEPRFCTALKQVKLGNSGEFGLLVRISPPIEGGQYTDSDEDIGLLVLSARLGRTLFPIDEWPFYVRVFICLLKDPESHDLFQKDDLAMVAFGRLLQSVKSGGSGKSGDTASSLDESVQSPVFQVTFFPEESAVNSSLKEELAKCCDRGMASKAFLVPISHGHSSYRQLALCVSGAELRAEQLLRCVRETRTARSNLDVVFLTETQVLEVSLVAKPFYERGA